MGYDAGGPLNNAALLQLNNNAAASSSDWKALLLPYVDFSDATLFNNSTVWGIAGSATPGALVYNTGNRNSGGFTGPGVYTWDGTEWKSLNEPFKISGIGTCAPGASADPDTVHGATGCVTFTYRGQTVTYPTVRGADKKIWLQQSLGASRVAISPIDTLGAGHLFQWGRWDDGHQLKRSNLVDGSTLTARNPSGISSGIASFVSASVVGNAWWRSGATTDTWTAGPPLDTNGTDPCAALGAGWHIPSSNDWGNLATLEQITNLATGYESPLKLSATGRRSRTGTLGGATQHYALYDANYWSATPATASNAHALSLANSQGLTSVSTERASGIAVRCVKD